MNILDIFRPLTVIARELKRHNDNYEAYLHQIGMHTHSELLAATKLHDDETTAFSLRSIHERIVERDDPSEGDIALAELQERAARGEPLDAETILAADRYVQSKSPFGAAPTDDDEVIDNALW